MAYLGLSSIKTFAPNDLEVAVNGRPKHVRSIFHQFINQKSMHITVPKKPAARVHLRVWFVDQCIIYTHSHSLVDFKTRNKGENPYMTRKRNSQAYLHISDLGLETPSRAKWLPK